jgi:hypothetical protein
VKSAFRRLHRKLQILHQRGVVRSFNILLDSLALKLLQKKYGFHPWHAAAPLSARPYRRTVAEMVNGVKPEVVVEVGCGLGSILSLVQAKTRQGYDVDDGAVRAARMLRSKTINFTCGDMSCVEAAQIDVLILVNWIHDFSPEQLEIWLRPLLPRIRYLLLDAIDPENPVGYRFAHDFAFLIGLAKPVLTRRVDGEGRRFILYEVTR